MYKLRPKDFSKFSIDLLYGSFYNINMSEPKVNTQYEKETAQLKNLVSEIVEKIQLYRDFVEGEIDRIILDDMLQKYKDEEQLLELMNKYKKKTDEWAVLDKQLERNKNLISDIEKYISKIDTMDNYPNKIWEDLDKILQKYKESKDDID